MEILMQGWQFFVNNILTQPQYMIGLIVLIGYILLRKPWHETVGGTIKAIVGYMILSTGSGGMIATFKPILYGLNDQFGLNAAVIDPYFGQNAVQAGVEAGDAIVGGNAFSQVMILMAIAFVANILLVRFNRITKLRSVFTTGNVQIQQASTAFWLILFALPFLRNKPTATLIIMAIVLGLYWAVGSNLLVGYTQNLTDGAGFSLAHQQMFGVALFTFLAEKMHQRDVKRGKEGIFSKKIEDINLPGWMSIFNDNMVCTGILMLIFFGTIMGLLGKEYFVVIEQIKPEASFFFYVLKSCLSFAANLAILQLGVRTFVAELTVSFQGISNVFLRSAVPGVDCAVSFSFGSPNAVTIGFLAGATGQIVAILTLILMGSPTIIIAGFIPMFFDNAVIAVYANSKGGLKAAIIFPFIAGLCQVFGSAFIATHVGLVKYGGYLGMWDWAVLWSGFTLVMEYLGFIGLGLVIVFLIALPQIQYNRDKEGYFLITENYEEYKKQKGII